MSVPRFHTYTAETDLQVHSSLVTNPQKKARTSSGIDKIVDDGTVFHHGPLPATLTWDPANPNETIEKAQSNDKR